MITTHRPIVLVSLLVLISVAPAHGADVQTITHGNEVDLEAHLVAGKYVLFDFYADWCGPCRALEPRLLDLARRHPDELALRKVDVIDWNSDVARQYRLSSIPYMVLYGPDGARLAAGDAGSVLRRLESGLGGGGGRTRSGNGPPVVPVLAVGAIVAITLLLVRKRRRSPGAARAAAGRAPILPPVDTAADPGDPAIWFVLLQGSLDGPFTVAQLGELVRRGALEKTADTRRRGDASWRSVSDVLA